MATADEVIVQFEARVGKYERDLKRAAKTFEKTTGQQQRQIKSLERQFQQSNGAIGSSIRRLAGTLATAFSVRELGRLVDGFTRLQNNLRVAGLEGEALEKVQTRLFGTANQYGVELEALSGVFLKASLAQKELGVSTEDILRLNEITAASLKITGTSAEQAQGALLQLGQALGSGVVRAEEFNSILEGALPLAQAAARGIDGFEGSVSKLRTAVLDGTITSKVFFEGILKGGVETLEQAEKATLTLSGGVTALTNALTVYFGEADKANGVSAALGETMGALADNLDIIIPALAVVATILGGRFLAGAVAGGAGLRALAAHASIATTSFAGTALAARSAGAALLGVFGGPVGLAITALTLGIGYFASETASANAEAESLRATAEQNAAEFMVMAEAAGAAGKELAQLNIEQVSAAASAAGLKIDIDKLADAHYRAAVAARAQRVEEQALAAQMSGKRFLDLFNKELGAARDPARARGFGGADRMDARVGIPQSSKTRIEREQEAYKRIVNSAEYKEYKRDQLVLDAMRDAPVEVPAAGGGGTAAGAKANKKSGKAAEAAEKRRQRELEKQHKERINALSARNDILRQLSNDELAGEAEILDAQARAATNAQDRVDLQADLLNAEKELRYRALDDEFDQQQNRIDDLEALTELEKKQLTEQLAESKKAAQDQMRQLYGSRASAAGTGANGDIVVTGGEQGILVRQLLRDYERELENQLREELAMRSDTLHDLASIETNIDERHRLQRAALALDQQIGKSLLEQAIANGEIADADRARAELAKQQGVQNERQRRDEMSPMEQYQFDLQTTAGNLNNAIEGLGVDTLKNFNTQLADAIVNWRGFGDVATTALKSVAAGIIQLALEQVTMQIIGATLGTAATAATAAQAGVAAAAWAPAAALASLATLGANAGPAAAAIVSTNALTSALAVSGMGRKSGGPIRGDGGPREDKVLIAASPEEYMIQASAARRLGRATLDYINATGTIPSRANGGPVMDRPTLPSGIPSNRSGQAPSVYQTFVLDARGGVVTEELLQYVNETARTEGDRARGEAAQDAQKIAPAAMERKRRFGV